MPTQSSSDPKLTKENLERHNINLNDPEMMEHSECNETWSTAATCGSVDDVFITAIDVKNDNGRSFADGKQNGNFVDKDPKQS